MKPHKHAELIKLWAEGEIVQVSKLSSHDVWVDDESPTWCSGFNYRVKPKEYKMARDEWERVAEGKFLVTEHFSGKITYLTPEMAENESAVYLTSRYEVVREVGIRQPHFIGAKHPEGEADVVVVGDSGEWSLMVADDVTWDNVEEYIVLSEG